MAGKILNMSKVKQIIRLRENGVALQTISRSLGISRNTVKKYLRLIEIKLSSLYNLSKAFVILCRCSGLAWVYISVVRDEF